MALSLGDINKKNPARKSPKSKKARGKTLMPWQMAEEEFVEDSTQTTHKKSSPSDSQSATPETEANNTQTAHKKSSENTQRANHTQTTHSESLAESNDSTTHKTTGSTTHKPHTEAVTNSATNSTQTAHKGHTNSTQNSPQSELSGESLDNNTQTAHKPHTAADRSVAVNSTQTTHEAHTNGTQNVKASETAHKPLTTPHTKGTQLPTNRTQTRDNPHTNRTPHHTQEPHTNSSANHTQISTPEIEFKLRRLTGARLKLFDYIYNSCIETMSDDLVITYEALSHFTEVKFTSIKTTARRLDLEDGLIRRVSPRGGRGAPTIFSIPQNVRQIYARVVQMRQQTTHNMIEKRHTNSPATTHKPHTPLHTNDPSKLENLKNNYLLEESDLESLDISQLAEFDVGYKQLNDIRNQRLALTSTQLQELIQKFAVWIREPEQRTVKSPAGMFVKLAQQLANGQDVLSDVESEEDRWIQEQLDKAKARRERRESLRRELFQMHFEEWRESVGESELRRLVPETPVMKFNSKGWESMVEQHYRDHVWPSLSL